MVGAGSIQTFSQRYADDIFSTLPVKAWGRRHIHGAQMQVPSVMPLLQALQNGEQSAKEGGHLNQFCQIFAVPNACCCKFAALSRSCQTYLATFIDIRQSRQHGVVQRTYSACTTMAPSVVHRCMLDLT